MVEGLNRQYRTIGAGFRAALQCTAVWGAQNDLAAPEGQAIAAFDDMMPAPGECLCQVVGEGLAGGIF